MALLVAMTSGLSSPSFVVVAKRQTRGAISMR
jgi:hypothetical protein